jgi:hypothetical protein
MSHVSVSVQGEHAFIEAAGGRPDKNGGRAVIHADAARW